MLSSVISTTGTKFMTIDIRDFYLNTPTERLEFVRMKIANFPEDVIEHYNLRNKVVEKGNLYIKCVKGMYGLPHAGIIAQKLLEERLNAAGYYQSDKTPGFWKHKWRPICFFFHCRQFWSEICRRRARKAFNQHTQKRLHNNRGLG